MSEYWDYMVMRQRGYDILCRYYGAPERIAYAWRQGHEALDIHRAAITTLDRLEEKMGIQRPASPPVRC